MKMKSSLGLSLKNKNIFEKNVTAFIKRWVVALLHAWQSWQWVTPFRRGFALCSIISHYYISHLLPKIPMGEERHIHTRTRTHTYTYRWSPACSTQHPSPPKIQQPILAPSQESSLSRQPSPTSTTRQLLERKNHLNDTDETACHTAKQKSLGAWGNTLHPLWHYKTVKHELRPPGGHVLAKA